MSGKGISNATLGLRFMQNAQRAKVQAQVEAEQAKVKDDAEWEVSEEVKEAWGIGFSKQSETHITHETSYVPFLFSTEDEGASSSRPETSSLRGRRRFNERGQEVPLKESEAQDHEEDEAGDKSKDDAAARKDHRRPVAISGFKVSLTTGKKKGKNARTKTAQELIHEDTSLRSPPPVTPPAGEVQPGASAGFVKPAGVDDPSTVTARSKKRKQERILPDEEPLGSESVKRKKKKSEAP